MATTVFASNDDTEQRLPEGTVVAGIEVVSEIERGGMAVVYRGRRVHDGHPVALKVGTAEAAARHQTEERFKNEARVGNALHHPNIVRPLQGGGLDGPEGFVGRMYLVTELVEGRTLSWLMLYNQQGMPVVRAVAVAMQIAEAMVAMDEQGIVHRDLTPANIIIDDLDRVHVIDFGLAYALGDGDVERTPDLTMDGAAVGTPLYMSPQQAMHLEPRGAFDVYAFGVMLYEILSGAAPNSGLPPEEILAVRCNPKSKLFPLRRVAPKAPEELVGLVERCLAYDSEERPTAVELVECLKDVSDAVREPSPHEPSDPTDPTMIMRRPAIVAEGARPVGDETMVQLVQDNVLLPAVQRVRVLADEFSGGGAGGEADERRIIPLVDVEVASTVMESERGQDEGSPTERLPDQGDGRSRLVLVVAFFLLFIASVGVMAWWPNSGGQTSTEAAEESAVYVDAEAGPRREVELREPEDEHGPEAEPREPEAVPGVASEPGGKSSEPAVTEPRAKVRRPKGAGQKKAAPKPKGGKPGPLTSCAGQRVEAKDASKSKRWKAVLASTKDASCWSSGIQRSRLRANAFMNLGRYKACMRETSGQEAADLEKLHVECFLRENEGEP